MIEILKIDIPQTDESMLLSFVFYEISRVKNNKNHLVNS